MLMGLDISSNMAILNAFDEILPHRISAIADNASLTVSCCCFFVHVVFFLVLCVAFSICFCFHLQES